MSRPPAPLDDAVAVALRAWLRAAIDDTTVEVVAGQVNRVPEPLGDNYVVFWPQSRVGTSTTVETWDTTDPDPAVLSFARGSTISYQIDLHGPLGADMAEMIATLWRSTWGVSTFDAAVGAPTFATDPRQAPFINGEKQYETRWTMVLHLHAKPVVSTPQEFADNVSVTINPPVGD